MKIAIDAGHGSATAGKRTPDGYREHWANVKVAYYFAKAMERCGIAYIKTGWNDENAKDDVDVSLSLRQKTIKTAKCDYSISFHFNASGDGKTYNSGEGIETLISNKNPGDSKRMADCIQAQLIKGTKQKDRGVKTQALAMCNCATLGTKAAILIECAFMTNKREADLMQSDEFCKECAEETARGFCEYAGIKYVANSSETIVNPAQPVQNTFASYKVVVTANALNIRSGAGTNNKIIGVITDDKYLQEKDPSYYFPKTVYTIIEEKSGWGKLKSGAGWIALKYTQKC